MVGHPGAAPGVSPIRTARIAVFLMPEMIKWIRHADLHRALCLTKEPNRCLFVAGMCAGRNWWRWRESASPVQECRCAVLQGRFAAWRCTRSLRDAIALLYC